MAVGSMKCLRSYRLSPRGSSRSSTKRSSKAPADGEAGAHSTLNRTSEARVQSAMADYPIRAATLDDLEALTDIYNHYVVHTAITFDLYPFTASERRPWLDDHSDAGPHRLLVATDDQARCLGYASSSRWRPKPA